MLERLLEEVKVKSVLTTFFDYDAEVDWDLTMRCNYSCSYCESYDNSVPAHFKTLNECKIAIQTLKEYFGNKKVRVQILGGEPMLFKHWDSLLNLIYESGYSPKICTNLSINNKTLTKKIETLLPKNCIDVSWHTQFADENILVNNIETIKESGHLRTVSILADKRYWEKVVSAYNRVKHLDSVEISYIKDEAAGKNKIASKLTKYTEEEISFIESVNKKTYTSNYKTEIIFKDDQKTEVNSITQFFEKGINNFKGLNCDVGLLRLQIKPNGDVFPSACLLNFPKAKMGNLYEGIINKPKQPIKCPFTFCGCGGDLRINKYE
jgi:organic radical activating enzyme